MKLTFFILLLFTCSQTPTRSKLHKKECKSHLTLMADDTAKDYILSFNDTSFHTQLLQTFNLCRSFNYTWVSNQKDTWKIRGTNQAQSGCVQCSPKFRLNNNIFILINSKGNVLFEEEPVLDVKNFDSIYSKHINQHLKDLNHVTISIGIDKSTPVSALEMKIQKVFEGNIRFIEERFGKKICEMSQLQRNKVKELYKFRLDLHIAISVNDLPNSF